MFKKFIYLIPICLGFCYSCSNDDDSTGNSEVQAKITFSPVVNNLPYSISDTVEYHSGLKLRYDQFKFYVSNVRLVNNSNVETYIDSVSLIDYSVNGNRSIVYSVNSDQYSKIRFNLGLTEDFNQSDPTKVDYNHPLSPKSDMFWSWGTQYKFITLQGNYGESTDLNLPTTFAWHPGKSELLKTIELDLESLTILENSEIIINLEIADLMDKTAIVDVPNEPTWHGSPSNISTAHKIVDNFVASLSIKK